jgi:enterochelin esterase-like enzyme
MKHLLSVTFVLLSSMLATAQTFESMVNSIASQSPELKKQSLDNYFSSGISFPIIEGNSTVFFIFRGKADSVFIAGDATGWDPSMKMQRIDGTDTWYSRATYEPDARLEYKIVVNKKDWILDAFNKRIVTGGTGQNSEFLMPSYELPRYIYERDVVPWGTYSDTVIYSKYLGEARPIRIYLPAGYEKSNGRYPVAFFHDGFEFFDRTAARDIMDNMTYEKKIHPLIAVFVQPVHRDDEYSGKLQAKYTRFMTEELIPFMDKGYKTIAEPTSRAQLGISNGGNIALWLVASHPEKTAGVAAFSSNVVKNINKNFLKNGCKNQKIYLDLGKYDLPDLIPMVRNLRDQLENEGCNISYHEYNEGHSWKFWQKYLPEALIFLFPPD